MASELYLNPDQMRSMKRHGMFFGIHGFDHYWLGKLKEEKMRKDIDRALAVMAPFINKNDWVMNFPYGNYSQEVIKYIKERGACLGLTTEVAVADFNKYDMFEMPRFDCNDFPPISDNYKKFINII